MRDVWEEEEEEEEEEEAFEEIHWVLRIKRQYSRRKRREDHRKEGVESKNVGF